jgi:23S rRNA pseudouridine1911/1915/1917 synthase
VSDFEVDEAAAGTRLDVALADHLGVSRSRAAARILAGEVLVDGVAGSKQHRLRAGESITLLEPPTPAPVEVPPMPPVRYEDEHLLVVAKPAGLVVHPGAGTPHGTLVDALRGAGVELADGGDDRRPGIVHRLDRDTSGLLVVAKSAAAYAGLVEALRERRVARRYLALVAGLPARPRGRIEGPIGRDPGDRLRFAVVADGKPATTRYELLADGDAPEMEPGRGTVALLACRLLTGRTHQIRVHLTELGHPIVGDPVYRPKRSLARALGLERPFLHAAALGFVHPVTGTDIALQEPLPDELVAALDTVGIAVPGPLTLDDDGV